jgi:hypothetical protein
MNVIPIPPELLEPVPKKHHDTAKTWYHIGVLMGAMEQIFSKDENSECEGQDVYTHLRGIQEHDAKQTPVPHLYEIYQRGICKGNELEEPEKYIMYINKEHAQSQIQDVEL